MTPNGKVDRRALPAPDGARAAETYVPRGPARRGEQASAELWKQVLGVGARRYPG